MILINDQPILQSLIMEIWLVLLMCPPIALYIPLILLLIFFFAYTKLWCALPLRHVLNPNDSLLICSQNCCLRVFRWNLSRLLPFFTFLFCTFWIYNHISNKIRIRTRCFLCALCAIVSMLLIWIKIWSSICCLRVVMMFFHSDISMHIGSRNSAIGDI
jgi:hypothetical protein